MCVCVSQGQVQLIAVHMEHTCTYQEVSACACIEHNAPTYQHPQDGDSV